MTGTMHRSRIDRASLMPRSCAFFRTSLSSFIFALSKVPNTDNSPTISYPRAASGVFIDEYHQTMDARLIEVHLGFHYDVIIPRAVPLDKM